MCYASNVLLQVAALVAIVKLLFPRFDYEWLAHEIRDNLPTELDFRIEADNAEAAAAAFKHRPDVRVPGVYRAVSSARVLTMTFEDGVYADKVRAAMSVFAFITVCNSPLHAQVEFYCH